MQNGLFYPWCQVYAETMRSDEKRDDRHCNELQPLRTGPFLSVKEVAQRLHCSTRTIHELTRTRRIPHVKRPGGRRCLFRSGDLARWERGAGLEVTELPQGGRVVRPIDDQDLEPPGGRAA